MDSTAASGNHVSPRVPVLINRDFAALWSGQAISSVGDFLFDTTLILWVATGIVGARSWAPLAVTGVLIAATVPMILVAPLAGVYTDRWDKRRTMLVTDALRALLILALLPLTRHTGLPVGAQLALVYADVFLVSMCSQFFNPSRMAFISDIVEEGEERTRASGLAQMTFHFSTLIGPPLAGPLFLTTGAGWALGVNAISFGVSFAAILSIRLAAGTRSVAPGERPDTRRELVAGLRYFAGNRMLMVLLAACIIAMLGAGSMQALDYFFVRENLHASAGLYGLLTAGMGIGALAGAGLTTAFARKISPSLIFWAGMVLSGLGITAYSRMTSFVPAFVLLAVSGVPMAALNVAVMPLIFEATPRTMIGRVASVINPTLSVVSLGSMALAGYLVSTLLRGFHGSLLGMRIGPIDLIFSVTGVCCVVAGLVAMVGLRGTDRLPKSTPLVDDNRVAPGWEPRTENSLV